MNDKSAAGSRLIQDDDDRSEMLDIFGPVSAAVIEGDYRYSLNRTWDHSVERLMFVMLNPSTADSTLDDPTIRRCIGFARRQNFGGITVVNLYAYRATDPAAMRVAIDPIGSRNDDVLRAAFESRAGGIVVAAWGVNAEPSRVADVLALVPGTRFVALGTTKDGHPRHPLYVRGDAPFIDWSQSSPHVSAVRS